MSWGYTYASRQWRRISTYETYLSYSDSYSPALTSRVPRELEWAINNAKAFVNAPRRQMTFFPKLQSIEACTDERVMRVLSPIEIADGYTKLHWTIGHERVWDGITDPGSGEKTTWRLYCSWGPLYTGGDIMDTAFLSPWYYSDSIETTSDSHDFDDGELTICKDEKSLAWLVLTAQNSTAAYSARLTQLNFMGRLP